MWFVGGAKTKVSAVEGGRVAERHCDACGQSARFLECDVKDTLHVLFVDLLDTSHRRMVCSRCGDDHDVDDFFATMGAARATGAPSPREAPKPPSAKLDAGRERVDDDVGEELAALKRKLADERDA